MSWMYKTLLWKAYFDRGFGLLSYVKYPLTIIGIGASVIHFSIFWIILISMIYGIICLILGRVWFAYKLVNIETDIQNMFNPFCIEMREGLKSVYRKV